MKITIDTATSGDIITQDIYGSGADDVREHLSRKMLDTSEAQVRVALMGLGWTPPGSVKTNREAEMEELLISAHAIALRAGAFTAWDRFAASIKRLGIGATTARTYKIHPLR